MDGGRAALIESCAGHIALQTLVNVMPGLPIPVRKAIMTICRVQQDPSRNPRLHKAIAPVLQFRGSVQIHGKRREIHFASDILPLVIPYISSPVILGFVSMILRCIPLEDEESAKIELADGVEKEIRCALGPDFYQQLDYRCLFGRENEADVPLHASIGPRKELALQIRSILHSWKESLSKQVLYPTYQRSKSVGDETIRSYESHAKVQPGTRRSVTTLELEKSYSEDGRYIEGPCEVRWAWKYNDLKPRVYYAQGGSAYFCARYIRRVANSLCDSFPASAVKTRYSIQRLTPVTSDTLFAIYDYASFTSRLTELKHFLEELGQWCKGTMIWTVDSNRGPVQVDLGTLILEYNDGVNRQPEMDLSRIYGIYGEGQQYEHHNRSGMLGVYGNIVFSTALHGIFLTFIAGGHDKANVVGDDAGGLFKMQEWSLSDLLDTLRILGDVNDTKMESWEEGKEVAYGSGWQFLKRPVDRISNILTTGILFDIPLVIYVVPPPQDFHTVDAGDLGERVKAFVMQTSRLFDRLHVYEHRLSEEDIDFALQYLSVAYRRLRLPFRGALPPFYHPHWKTPIHVAIPILDRESIARPWLDVLCEEMAGRMFSLPRYSWTQVEPEDFVTVGQSFEATTHRSLTLGEDLGYVEKELSVDIKVMDAPSSIVLKSFLSGQLNILYTFTYIAQPPSWWRMLPYIQ